MKKFTVVGQIESGEDLEKLTNYISNAVETFEKKHGNIEELDVQLVVAKAEEPPILTDARSTIGFQPPSSCDEEYYE